MVIEDLHEGVWRTRVIYVVRTIAAATSVETPTVIHLTNSQSLTMSSALCLSVGDLFASVLRDSVSASERLCGKAAVSVNG